MGPIMTRVAKAAALRRSGDRVVQAHRLAWYRERGRLLDQGSLGRDGFMGVNPMGINGRMKYLVPMAQARLEREGTAILRAAGVLQRYGVVRV